MSHFQYIDHSEMSKEDWDYIYKLAKNSLGNDINDYNSILSFEEKLLNKKSNDFRYSPKRIKHVLGAERGFVNKKLNLNTSSHSELLAYYNLTLFEDYKLDIMEALNGAIDIYISYYSWFIEALFTDYLPIYKLKEIVIRLCKSSASELDKNVELLSLYATMEIIDGNIHKGLAIYDDLFSRDQFNLLMYLRLLDVLREVNEYNNLNKYAKQALDVAISLEDDETIEIIENFIEGIDDDIEINSSLSLMNFIKNPPQKNEIENSLLKLAMYRFEEEGKILLNEKIEEKYKSKAFDTITKYCKTCLEILKNKELQKEFIDLSNDLDEVQAVTKIMENL